MNPWQNSIPDPRRPYEIRRIGGGQDLAVQLDEVLLDLRIDSADENETVTRLIRGMTDFFEGRTGWRLSPAQYELLISPGCGEITVERGPFRELLGCWRWDCENRTWVEIDLANILINPRGREFDVIFSQAAMDAFPSSYSPTTRAIRLQFEAGFDSPEVTETTVNGDAEDGMIVSLKALIAEAYENREAGGWDANDPSKDYLLQRYRKFW